MKISVDALAQQLGLSYSGDGTLIVNHACGLDGTESGGISYVQNAHFVKTALASPVQVLVCGKGMELPGKTCLYADYPDMMIVQVTKLLHPEKVYQPAIHPSFISGEGCQLGKDVTIEPHVVVGNHVTIGNNTIIHSGVSIGDHCTIGDDCFLHPNVTIRNNSTLGDRVVVNSGTVIGAEGFGFVTHKGKHYKIPQVGYVHIEDDVELGACNTIDRGRFGVTRLGKGTKTDNLVHVGHNVEIGEDSLIVGMVGFAGSTKTGHHLTMGGQSMMSGHLKIGNHVTVSAKSLLAKNVGDGQRYSGIPARLHKEWLKAYGFLYKLQKVFDFMKRSGG